MKHTHIRFENGAGAIDNRMGATVAWTVDGDRVAIAISACSPGDNFCRKTGTKLALERAEQGDVIEMSKIELDAMLEVLPKDSTKGEAMVRSAIYLARTNRIKVAQPDGKTSRSLETVRRMFGIK